MLKQFPQHAERETGMVETERFLRAGGTAASAAAAAIVVVAVAVNKNPRPKTGRGQKHVLTS